MAVKRIFVEKKVQHSNKASAVKSDALGVLGIELDDVRVALRYDIEGLSKSDLAKALCTVFSEPPVDEVYLEKLPAEGYSVFAVELLPGQYDQRADSAAACCELLLKKSRPLIACATVYMIKGATKKQLERIKKYYINPVEAREATLKKPKSLAAVPHQPPDDERVEGFTRMTNSEIEAYHASMGFAMSVADLCFVRDYFKSEERSPYITELKVIDTYWSDHCRHTTFLTELKSIENQSGSTHIDEAIDLYNRLFNKFNSARQDKYRCLMDIATIGAKEVRANGGLGNLDQSEEINACSVKIDVDVNGKDEKYLLMFKNETHNHPTEIEPFGGAATCLGGAIRDPLSGRSYVYQSMRVTGAADPNKPYDKTLKGKLPQRVITTQATAGFSSYGNQIGLATGQVAEVYHEGYQAKRLETGFVIAAAPQKNVVRQRPEAGDKIILLGGETGRDGCGGATGSSKAHTEESIDECGAEVQKGNPLTERKLQRLFRDGKVTRMIKRCNDFGAGGVSVAIGELADSLDIYLDSVPKKYEGLSGTEIAISESQERMAVVVRESDVQAFIAAAAKENLSAVVVADVTDTGRMRMYFKNKCIVDLKRDMLNTNGVKQEAAAVIPPQKGQYFGRLDKQTAKAVREGDLAQALLSELSRLNVCANKGMSETFDSTIGAGTVLLPWGGRHQLTPSLAMAAKIPVFGDTNTVSVAAWGFNPALTDLNPFLGSVYAVLLSAAKATLAGAEYSSIRLTLQEFFLRLGSDPKRWGQPLAALLGALAAQVGLNLAAIGGKDSMSGSFEDIDVPNTLISFAVGTTKQQTIITNVLSGGEKIYRIKLKRDREGMPDLDHARELLQAVSNQIASKKITFATVVEEGGAAAAIAKSALGNRVATKLEQGKLGAVLQPDLGDLLIAGDLSKLTQFNPELVAVCGESEGEGIEIDGKLLSFYELEGAYLSTLENVFPTATSTAGAVKAISYPIKSVASSTIKTARPVVLLPVFPGTNCEYDTAKQFELAGAKTVVCVIKNRTPDEIAQSVRELTRHVKKANILAIPGGFSGGDEPDGSGKFIATTFQSPRLADAVTELLEIRDGLALGICNGFQALIKLGLLPQGKITPQKADSATLTFNQIARHVSTISRIRVTGATSPWLLEVKAGEVFNVAVSHGEGRLIAPPAVLKAMIEGGQVATQYVDLSGAPTMQSPHNPNGSMEAIEGIISPNGRVFGKMGHSERIGQGLYKNLNGNYDMKIFTSAVKYYK